MLGLFITILVGCGGGDGTETETPEEPAPLTLSNTDIPDDELRECVNALAIQNNWQQHQDVTHIRCPGVEIQSIEGLQAFPNLSVLKISAPRFNLEELPLLAALPLDDFLRSPFYESNNDPSSVQPAIKQILLDERIIIPWDVPFTLLFLTVNDPSRQADELLWNFESSENMPIPFSTFGSKGKLPINDRVTLHWARFDSLSSVEPVMFFYYQDLPKPQKLGDREIGFSNHNSRIWPKSINQDQDLTELTLRGALADCISAAAQANGWVRAWEVTTLDCRGYDIAESFSQLANFSQLRSLSVDIFTHANLNTLRALPYLETLHAPGLILEPHEISLYPWNITPEPQVMAAPEISIQECGLLINNFDPAATYTLYATSNNELAVSNHPVNEQNVTPWSPEARPDCMALSGEFAWKLRASKNGFTTVARSITVTNNEGQVLQMIYSDLISEPAMTVPGIPNSYYYVVRKFAPQHYHLEQYELESWNLVRTLETEQLPILATSTGVYFIEEPGDRYSEHNRVWFLPAEGTLTELPPMPLAATANNALVFNGEVWFYNLSDDWDTLPNAMIWNPVTETWRTLSRDGRQFSLTILDGQLCAQYLDSTLECLAEDGLAWETVTHNDPIYGSGVQKEFVSSTLHFLEGLEMSELLFSLYPFIPVMEDIAVPSYLSDFRMANEYVYYLLLSDELLSQVDILNTRPGILLDARDPYEPYYVAPVLPSVPWRSNYKTVGDTLYMLFNDSIARYTIPVETP